MCVCVCVCMCVCVLNSLKKKIIIFIIDTRKLKQFLMRNKSKKSKRIHTVCNLSKKKSK